MKIVLKNYSFHAVSSKGVSEQLYLHNSHEGKYIMLLVSFWGNFWNTNDPMHADGWYDHIQVVPTTDGHFIQEG